MLLYKCSGKEGVKMDDSRIIALFTERSEQAIKELAKKYGKLCGHIAKNILQNEQDAEECVSDAYMGCWNTIPPEHPVSLQAYVCRIVRNISITKYRANTAGKRNSHYDASLDELEECLASRMLVEEECEAKELGKLINLFLGTLDRENRIIFVRRYWYGDEISDIAEYSRLSENNVYVRLSRTRSRLREFLKKEGFLI